MRFPAPFLSKTNQPAVHNCAVKFSLIKFSVMKTRWQFLLAFLFFGCGGNLAAQNVKRAIDSLLVILKTEKEDTSRVNSLNELTLNCIRYGNSKEAKTYAESAVKLSGKLNFNKGKATAYANLGVIYTYSGNSNEALKNFNEALNIFERLADKRSIANVLRGIGDAYRRQGNKDQASKTFQSSLKIEQEIGNKEGIARSLNNVALMNITEGNYSDASKNLTAALKIEEEIGDKFGMAISFHHIGIVNDDEGNYADALKNYQAALNIQKEMGYRKAMGATVNNMGIIYDYQGNFQESLKCYLTSLRLFREMGDKYGMANSLINIGYVYGMQSNHREALKNDLAALKLFEEIGDKSGIALSHNNTGNSYKYLGNYALALSHTQEALQMYEEIGDKPGVALCNNNMGTLYQKQGNYTEALKHSLLSLKLFSELGEQQGIADVNVSVGTTLYKRAATENALSAKRTLTEAVGYLTKGLKVGQQIGSRTAMSDAYDGLTEAYKGLRNYQKALQYHMLYSQMKDSVMNSETAHKLEQQRTEFEVEKAVAEEKAQKQKLLDEQKLRSEKKDQLMLTGFSALAVVFLFVVLFLRQRNQKRRAIERAEAMHTMTELELQSLRAQLNPHFMFNSLNAIQDLILKEDNERSHLYLSRFSKLLRILLDNASQPFVSIRQELDFLELYLSLENLRIPNLKFSIDKDPNINTEQRMMPNMILQPYIENAIWHGLSNKKGSRNLYIRIHENGSATEFEIEDNGVGRKKAAEIKKLYRHGHHSKGMELLSKRFNLLSKEYGATIHTTVTDLENNGEVTGTLVKIDVPFTLSEQAKQLTHDTHNHN